MNIQFKAPISTKDYVLLQTTASNICAENMFIDYGLNPCEYVRILITDYIEALFAPDYDYELWLSGLYERVSTDLRICETLSACTLVSNDQRFNREISDLPDEYAFAIGVYKDTKSYSKTSLVIAVEIISMLNLQDYVSACVLEEQIDMLLIEAGSLESVHISCDSNLSITATDVVDSTADPAWSGETTVGIVFKMKNLELSVDGSSHSIPYTIKDPMGSMEEYICLIKEINGRIKKLVNGNIWDAYDSIDEFAYLTINDVVCQWVCNIEVASAHVETVPCNDGIINVATTLSAISAKYSDFTPPAINIGSLTVPTINDVVRAIITYAFKKVAMNMLPKKKECIRIRKCIGRLDVV